jgi:periplasmic protein TonB
MQSSNSEKNEPVPPGSEVALGRCLVEGDPAVTSLARRARRKAFGASLALETSLLALILIVPLLTGVARPPLGKILQQNPIFLGAWHAHGPVQQVAPPATVHPPSISNPFAEPHPISGVTVRPIYSEGPEGPGSDIPGPYGPGEIQVIDLGRQPLPVEPPRVVPPPQQEKRPVKVSGGVMQAQLISRVEPRYPPLAVQTRQSGTVVLHAIISRDGRIDALQVVSGSPFFVQAALEAVRQWRYRPTMLDGEPVEVETTISVEFRLQN